MRIGAFPVTAGKEYTVRAKVRADPGYAAVSPLFASVPRTVFFALGVADVPAADVVHQDVLADSTWRNYSISFVAAKNDPRA